MMEEVDSSSANGKQANPKDVCIDLNNCAYSWGYTQKKEDIVNNKKLGSVEKVEASVIENINLKMEYNDTMVVAGRIGTGKTSLLYSIMNETIKKTGDHKVLGSIAYVEQEPFIFSGTVVENITFGLIYNKERFEASVKAA